MSDAGSDGDAASACWEWLRERMLGEKPAHWGVAH
jgi:hypothetical protein